MRWLVLTLIISCAPNSQVDQNFMLSRQNYYYNFDVDSEYTYPSKYVQISASIIGLKPLDLTVDSSTEFSNGTSTFTNYTSSQITLNSATSNSQALASDWTPQWDNIVGYWKLDNNVLDSSGNGNTGNLRGGTFFTTDRQIGTHAAYFDDNSDRIEIAAMGDLDFGTNFSFSLWVKKLAAPVGTQDFIYGGHECPGACIGQSLALNPVTCYTSFYDSNTGYQTGSKSVCNGLWHHIAVTYDSGTLKTFVDGALDINATISASLAAAADVKAIGGFSTGGVQSLEGWLDDFMLWDTQLTDAEISYLYQKQKQKYAGLFESEVYNLGSTSGLWESLGWTTEVPYGKEIPISEISNENSSQYPGTQEIFMTGLLGNYQMDDLSDSVGLSPNGFIVGNTYFSTLKKLGSKSVFLDGVGDYIQVTGPTNMNFTSNDFTISAWFRSVRDLGNNQPLIYMGGSPLGFFSMSLVTGTGFPIVSTRDSTNNTLVNCTGTTNYVDQKWHQITIVRNSTSDLLYVYIDGEEEISCPDVRTGAFNLSGNTFFGWQFGNTFHGQLDEFVFLDKALSLNEVKELYRRGANEILHQVRSCATDPCTIEPWLGPDGTSRTWFRESENCVTINGSGLCSGATEGKSPLMLFSNFVTPPTDNQFFQYRSLLTSSDESDACDNDGDNTFSEPCLPQLNSITVNINKTSFIAATSFVTNEYTEYKEIIDITSDARNCVTFQVTKDKTSFYYHDGNSWVVATDDVLQTNTLNQLRAFINNFELTTNVKKLYLRVYLSSDTTTSCSFDEIYLDSLLR